MKLAIIGSRSVTEQYYEELKSFILSIYSIEDIEAIVSGGAKGSDALAVKVATEWEKELIEFKPDWKKYGRGAGPVRNTEIVNYSDACIAVVDKPLERSKGTYDSVKKFRKQDKRVDVLTVGED